jgi:hypothetical protein
MEDVHLKTDTLYRVCRAVRRSFDEAVHNTVRESKGIQTKTVALFIRKRIYPHLEQWISPQPWTIAQFASKPLLPKLDIAP